MISTKMTNAEGDLPVERVGLPEHFSSEESNVHLYIPKGEAYSSMHPRVQLPWVNDNAVRNLAVSRNLGQCQHSGPREKSGATETYGSRRRRRCGNDDGRAGRLQD